MSLYEKRTYTVAVGKMPEVIRIYRDEAFPAMQAGGFDKYLVGYFVSDTGTLHQLVHVWKFDDDDDRRAFWKRLFDSEAFMAAAVKVRSLLERQEVQLLLPAPWGPHP